MSHMLYRGYRIQARREAEHQYAVHLFRYNQADAKANRTLWPGKHGYDSNLTPSDGHVPSFRSVTDAMTAAQAHIDGLRTAASAGYPP